MGRINFHCTVEPEEVTPFIGSPMVMRVASLYRFCLVWLYFLPYVNLYTFTSV